MSTSYPTSPLAQLVTERDGGVLVVRVTGEIDLSNAEEVQARLMAPLVDVEGLVVDLSDATYLDSTGIRVLFRVAEHLRGRSLPMRVVASPDAHTRRVLELTRFDQRAALDDSLESARTAMRHPVGPSDDAVV